MTIRLIERHIDDNSLKMTDAHSEPTHREFFSIGELAKRWRCSRGTVYNRIRLAGVKVLDFGVAGRKSKKLVAAAVVFYLEAKYTKGLP